MLMLGLTKNLNKDRFKLRIISFSIENVFTSQKSVPTNKIYYDSWQGKVEAGFTLLVSTWGPSSHAWMLALGNKFCQQKEKKLVILKLLVTLTPDADVYDTYCANITK